MQNFYRISLILAVFVATAALGAASLRAQSFTYTPDTLYFTPNGADSVEGYVRIAYAHDTTKPGTYIHCWISDGSSYFSCPTDTVHDTTYFYLRVEYKTQTDTVRGSLTISDDTITRTVLLIGYPNPPPPVLSLDGPYFPSNIREGADTCVPMRMVNSTSSPDTIREVSWSHGSDVFKWDSVTLPYILGSHDTVNWTFCFHAPDNTTEYIDTFTICCNNSPSSCISRVIEAAAVTYDGELSAVGPYFPEKMREGTDTCETLRLVNTNYGIDTITSITWSHNPNGIFTWDSTKLPFTIAAHDTTYLTFCYHAPDNTETYTDTLIVGYNDPNGTGWYDTRIVSAAAVTSDGSLYAEGPYFPTKMPEGSDTCVATKLYNTGSSVDTVTGINWSHNPNGIFSWDSSSIPFTIAAHDSTTLTFCYHAPDNTETYTDTINFIYSDASGSGWDDSRVVAAAAIDTTPPDGELDLYSGPYFPEVVDEGHDTCATMRVINSGDDLDTIVSASWSHNPNGIFTWDSVSLPTTIGSHDTDNWTFCFHAPDDTNEYIDTFVVVYHDKYSSDRYVTRIIEAKATNPYLVTCYTLYAKAFVVTNVGDTSYIHMYVRNDLPDSATLTSCHISGSDDGAFRVDSANFPITVAPNTYDSVELMFIPNRTSSSYDYDTYSATLTATFTTADTDECRAASVALSGTMPQPCTDTVTVDVDTSGTDNVDISGDSGKYYAHRIDFVNTSKSTMIISAINWLDSSTHFLIAQTVPPLPDTLASGAGMAIIIHFYGDSSGTIYYDTLALTIESDRAFLVGKATPLSANTGVFLVKLRGLSAAPAGVTTPSVPAGPSLTLYPNPSSGIVNMEIDGATNATFEVVDILGNILASHGGSGTWQWDANSYGISNGTYFIRASSGGSVTTKRLVIQR